MANVVDIKPEMIRWAVERSGLPLDDFPDEVERWIQRQAKPTHSKLQKFAKRAMVPFGFLFLNEPPAEEIPMPDYRTLDDGGVQRPSPNLLDTVYGMRRRQAWMREYLIENGQGPLPFLGSFSTQSPVRATICAIRRELNLPLDWAREHKTWEGALRFFARQVEAAGVLVFFNGVVGNNSHRALDPEEFRGFVINDDIAPLIFVNAADTKGAQMFTVAHELAHLWIGESALFNLPMLDPGGSDVETFCNRIAAELLVPDERIRVTWERVSGLDKPFHRLARHFKVSPIVIGRRVKDLGLITPAEFFGFYHAYRDEVAEAKRKKPSGGDFYRTQNARLGRRFGQVVATAAESGALSWQEAYRLTGLFGQTFDRYISFLRKQV
ncbi:MAG: ImmA/IrrE family metallo-endopeptidase [Planctomycetaceae bacterium]|nr:MAG: ImmA/IrrE family metallo-endopeptidase [Planctomycetaceae bacterium]